jgi:signal transduction histidine kinase
LTLGIGQNEFSVGIKINQVLPEDLIDHPVANFSIQVHYPVPKTNHLPKRWREGFGNDVILGAHHESVIMIVIINDLAGRLVDFNPAAAQTHSYTLDEFRQLQPPQLIHPDSQYLFDKYKEALYRIASEALNNIVRHARASKVLIRLDSCTESIPLQVRDEGVGFDLEDRCLGHLGLHSMRERAVELDGRLEIASFPGQCTCITVRIPPATWWESPVTILGRSEVRL